MIQANLNPNTRTFADAIRHLESVQNLVDYTERIEATGVWLPTIPQMVEQLAVIGYTPADLNALNVIHVAGTKGKGSTSTFVASMLHSIKPTWTVDTIMQRAFTSPYFLSARDHISLNGSPISEEDFAKYFFEVWDRLDAKTPGLAGKTTGVLLMALVVYHTFLSLKVDAAVLEVRIGGAFCSTNLVPKPRVTLITSLGLDHVSILGDTIAAITWHKAGIFKEGVPALTVEQPESAAVVLREQAVARKVASLETVSVFAELESVHLDIDGEHQRQNASLAIRAVQIFLNSEGFQANAPLPRAYVDGLERARVPGRCQKVPDPQRRKITWFLDCAHTEDSLNYCIDWFVSPGNGLAMDTTHEQPPCVLIYCTPIGRAGVSFLNAMIERMEFQRQRYNSHPHKEAVFSHVLFIGGAYTKSKDLVDQLVSVWCTAMPNYPKDHVHGIYSAKQIVEVLEALALQSSCHKLNVLMTGSAYFLRELIPAAGLSDAVWNV